MCYKKAKGILPENLIKVIQEYIDGEYLYIPRKENLRKSWGENTNIKKEIEERNESIYSDYINGLNTKNLSKKYFLSQKSIQRIIRETKMKDSAN